MHMVTTLTTNLAGPNFSQPYSLIAGSTFAEHTEPGPYLEAAGLGPDKTGDDYDPAVLLDLDYWVLIPR